MRLVLFDLDDTLVDLAGAFGRWAVEFVGDHDLPSHAVSWLVAANRRATGPKDRLFAEIRAHFGLTDPVDRLWGRYRSRIPELVALRPFVLDGLVGLRAAGWRLGVVTNGQPDNQVAKLRRTGLADHVDGWCVSAEVGVRKPDPAIFRSAARRCGRPIEDGRIDGWMVGDSAELDVDGGRRAGLATFWISHGRPWPADLTPPDRVASDTHLAIQALLERR
ncbi:putative hydrolase of the HAD superfamily [Saccharothrix ecbatanensis]|uniref:Putative hydrolase of the HAD superfamily n=1 Tax=Saccharothrix ecbatanensis TaxID=1105145 RepID=A0A7W9HHJ2_9PSEU|nr:HAD-IA family hydrolase [Saccharothrix ecbatanensis]MBB5802280.1 putative hydrolase of the HAD superfamily [Saccharothrix ecbatanensis]